MSAFKKFKQRNQAKKAELSQLPEAQTAHNQALTLLAKLLNVTEAQAIAEAEKYIESNITFFEERIIGLDLASGQDKTVTLELNPNEHGIHTKAEADALAETFNQTAEEAADNINSAATEASEQLSSAANNVETTADDLAYTAADIANATEELKEATTELKKPSAVPKSSHSKKAAEPKKNSKK